MRIAHRLLVPCLVLIGACSHSARPATTAAAAVPQRPAARPIATRTEAPPRAASQLAAPTRATTHAVDASAPATTQGDGHIRTTARADAPTQAFAPTSQTVTSEEACGEARVGFVAGSSVLDAAARQRLDAYAACVTEDRAQAVYISGTTDPGSDSTNLGLANARARAVADYLHRDGLHMDFEVHAYRAGSVPQPSGRRQVGRSATVTTESPYRRAPR